LAAALCAADEGAYDVVKKAQEDLSEIPVATSGSGGVLDQPNPTRLGYILCGRALDAMFRLHQGLGGKEDSATFDAGTEAPGLRLEKVE
jgi:hypothetical protein